MKILLINNAHFVRGGADKVYVNTGSLLEKKGHMVSYFALENDLNLISKYSKYFPKDPKFKSKNILNKLLFLPRYFYSFSVKHSLEKLLIKHKPDIAHVHLMYGGGLTSSILPLLKNYNVKVVLTIHDYKLLCPVLTLVDNNSNICVKCASGNYLPCVSNSCEKKSLGQKSIAYSIVFAAESWFRDNMFNYNKYISKYIFVSEFAKMLHIKYKPHLKIKSEVLFNFIDYKYDLNEFHENEDYYLYFGRLSKEKGIMTLIKSFYNLPNLNLVILGDGMLKKSVIDFINFNSIKNISIKGFASGEKLNGFIKKSKFVILPSEWYENNPLSIIEAFRFGKPVVASNIGGIPELVKDDYNGYLFDAFSEKSLTSAIIKAEKVSATHYNFLSKNASKFAANNFNADIHYEKLIEIYSSVI